jgi:hypothetical protein
MVKRAAYSLELCKSVPICRIKAAAVVTMDPMRRVYVSAGCLVLLAGVIGCRSNVREARDIAPPTTRAVTVFEKPAINLAKGGGGFPLDVVDAPRTIVALQELLQAAYAARLEANPSIDIQADGRSLGQLDRLSIDITGSTVKTAYTPQGPGGKDDGPTPEPRPFMRVGKLSYIADPLKYANYAASMRLEATDARLALIPDQDKKLSLALYDCREGSARISVGIDDLEHGLIAGSRARGLAFSVESVDIQLQNDTERDLFVQMDVKARVLLVPTSFRLIGRADVDDNFNIHFTGLSAQGFDPSGSLLAALLQGKLDKLNDRAAPLMRLPGDKIRVTDIRIRIDQRLTVDLKFAGTQ